MFRPALLTLFALLLQISSIQAKAPAQPTCSEAWKSYSAGSYLKASRLFEGCSKTMRLQSLLAASAQEGKEAKSLRETAAKGIERQLSTLEPEETEYSELLILKAWLLHLQGNDIQAARGLNFARIYASPNQQVRLDGLCLDIFGVLRDGPRRDSCASRLEKVSASLELRRTANPLLPSPSLAEVDGAFCLQIGAFSSRKNAEKSLVSVANLGQSTWIQERESNGKMLFLSRMGSFSSRAQALSFAEKHLKPLGMSYLPILR